MKSLADKLAAHGLELAGELTFERAVEAAVAAGWSQWAAERAFAESKPLTLETLDAASKKIDEIKASGEPPYRKPRLLKPRDIDELAGLDEAPPPSSSRRRLPVDIDALPAHERPRLYPGPGERFEACRHVAGCLGRLLQATKKQEPKVAHCPPWCTFKDIPGFEERLAEVRTPGAPSV